MLPLTIESFQSLFSTHEGICLSIYMPTRPDPAGAEHNRIHYKDLLHAGEKRLLERLAPSKVERLLAPLHALSTPEFWQHQQQGLGVFASERQQRHFLLSRPIEELVVVSDSFHVRPLLKLMQSNRRYYLLSLSQKHARLYRGTAEGLVPVEVPGLPHSLSNVVGDEEHQPRGSVRSTGGRGAGAVHYGGGSEAGATEEELRKYFKAIDHALWELLRGEKAPLVLAAPHEYAAAWRQVSRYPYGLDQGLHGNLEAHKLAALHEKAWPLVHEQAQQAGRRLLESFGASAAHGRGSAELSTVARAAVQGRVRELLLANGERLHGRLDRETGEVIVDKPSKLGDDVYDDIAEAVVLRGGDVLALPPAEMPGRVPIAALFRW